MEWMTSIGMAVDYIEEHITEDLSINTIAERVALSPFYFQKGFSLLCGISVSEYVRKRRLSLAGSELVSTDSRVIDVALKYGYDSPDSFGKAFARFHGVTPALAKREDNMLKSFAPLKIKFILEGGYLMDYKIMQKESFKVIGARKTFQYADAKTKIPEFWTEHYNSGDGKYVCGMFGVNYDEKMGNDTFDYMIADLYNPTTDYPERFVMLEIPAFTWAVFPCKGAMPKAFQSVNKKIFTEWLPTNRDYEFAAGYCMEMYDDPTKYPNGTSDESYYSELWIPVKKKD